MNVLRAILENLTSITTGVLAVCAWLGRRRSRHERLKATIIETWRRLEAAPPDGLMATAWPRFVTELVAQCQAKSMALPSAQEMGMVRGLWLSLRTQPVELAMDQANPDELAAGVRRLQRETGEHLTHDGGSPR